jgi:hypothetical protein
MGLSVTSGQSLLEGICLLEICLHDLILIGAPDGIRVENSTVFTFSAYGIEIAPILSSLAIWDLFRFGFIRDV